MSLCETDMQAIRDMIERYFDAYKHKNLGHALELFHPNIPVRVSGNGRGEYSLRLDQLQEQLKRDWLELDTIDYYINPVAHNIGYNMAWSFVTCHRVFTIADEKVEYPLLRVSFVFKRKGHCWYITQLRWSITNNEHNDTLYSRIPLNPHSNITI